MKNLQKFTIALMLLFSVSLFAQKSTSFNGNYEMDYGNQKMEIVTDGGMYYHVKFTGDCNARTHQGKVDNGSLMLPMGNNGRDFIMISWQGEKLRIDIKGEETMRKVCGGTSIIGLYSIAMSNSYSSYNENYHNHKNYNSDNFNNSYYTRDSHKYGSTADVYDLMKISAPIAYDKLRERGFVLIKTAGSDKVYKIWYNNETNQCIKTVSLHKHIHDVLKSTHCH